MADPANHDVNNRRRSLLQRGLGISPLLLTLAARPVLGNNQCFTPSGFVSMPTSQPGPPSICLGRSPDFWKQEQHFSQWPAPYHPTTVSGPGGHEATRFNAVFGMPSPYKDEQTFLDVLRAADTGLSGPPHDVARHAVASLLNIANGWVPVLSATAVIGIWRQYTATGGGAGGYFEPTAGVQWQHEQIRMYLQSTMTA